MTTVIKTKTDGRLVHVGENVNRDGTIVFDVERAGENVSICSDIPLVELLDALNKLDGVHATYEKPEPVLTFADLKPGTVFVYLTPKGAAGVAHYVKLGDGSILSLPARGEFYEANSQRDLRPVKVVAP